MYNWRKLTSRLFTMPALAYQSNAKRLLRSVIVNKQCNKLALAHLVLHSAFEDFVLLKSIDRENEDILLEPLAQDFEVHLGSGESSRMVSRIPAFVFPVLSMRFKQMADLYLDCATKIVMSTCNLWYRQRNGASSFDLELWPVRHYLTHSSRSLYL
jgi:hypothetical protein